MIAMQVVLVCADGCVGFGGVSEGSVMFGHAEVKEPK